jgi:hypothetical protein
MTTNTRKLSFVFHRGCTPGSYQVERGGLILGWVFRMPPALERVPHWECRMESANQRDGSRWGTRYEAAKRLLETD